MYFAPVPKKVICSFSAISNKYSIEKNGEPSYNIIEAFEANDRNQPIPHHPTTCCKIKTLSLSFIFKCN